MGSSLRDESSYLEGDDFHLHPPVDEEDEHPEDADFPENYWSRTSIECSDCEDPICFDEEVVLIQIVQAQNLSGQIECYPVLDDNGDFRVEPLFIHAECWEDLCEEYEALITDEPPQPSDAPMLNLGQCRFCNTGIRAWDEFAFITAGELTVAERRKETVFKAAEGGSPEGACLNCMNRINEDCISLWKDDPT